MQRRTITSDLFAREEAELAAEVARGKKWAGLA